MLDHFRDLSCWPQEDHRITPGPNSCASCLNDNLRPWVKIPGYSYLECRSCSLVSLESRQSFDPRTIYTSDYFTKGSHAGYTNYEADEHIHRLNARRYLRRMARLGARPPGSLLDIGCASGFFMSEAAKRGWTVYGVDVSPWSRDIAKARFGYQLFESIEVACERIRSEINVVTAFQVLEHVSDIRRTLRSIRRILSGTGHLIVETWNRDSLVAKVMGPRWQQLSPPSVLHLFDNGSMNRLLRDAGFRTSRLVPTAKYISAAWAAGLLGSKLNRRILKRISGWPLLRCVPLPYMLGDLVWMATHPDASALNPGRTPATLIRTQ